MGRARGTERYGCTLRWPLARVAVAFIDQHISLAGACVCQGRAHKRRPHQDQLRSAHASAHASVHTHTHHVFLHSLPGRFDPLCFTSHSTGSQKGKESLATNYLPALAVRSRSQTTTAALADDKHTLAVDLSSAAYQARTPPLPSPTPLAITPLSPCLGYSRPTAHAACPLPHAPRPHPSSPLTRAATPLSPLPIGRLNLSQPPSPRPTPLPDLSQQPPFPTSTPFPCGMPNRSA